MLSGVNEAPQRWRRTYTAERALWLETWQMTADLGMEAHEVVHDAIADLCGSGKHEEVVVWFAVAEMVMALCPPPCRRPTLH